VTPADVDQFLALPAWCAGVVAVVAASLALAFGCRVRALSVLEHRAPVWIIHLSGMITCGWIALAAVMGAQAHAVDVVVLAMAGGHIWGTYHTWSGGEVPQHVRRPQGQVLQWPVLSRSEDGEGQR
jgi:hypothetical protein